MCNFGRANLRCHWALTLSRTMPMSWLYLLSLTEITVCIKYAWVINFMHGKQLKELSPKKTHSHLFIAYFRRASVVCALAIAEDGGLRHEWATAKAECGLVPSPFGFVCAEAFALLTCADRTCCALNLCERHGMLLLAPPEGDRMATHAALLALRKLRQVPLVTLWHNKR